MMLRLPRRMICCEMQRLWSNRKLSKVVVRVPLVSSTMGSESSSLAQSTGGKQGSVPSVAMTRLARDSRRIISSWHRHRHSPLAPYGPMPNDVADALERYGLADAQVEPLSN